MSPAERKAVIDAACWKPCPETEELLLRLHDEKSGWSEIAARLEDHAFEMEQQRNELLEALQRSLNWLSSYPGGGAMGAYDQARKAIKNAEK